MKEWTSKYWGKIIASIGIILICGGTAVCIEAGVRKHYDAPTWEWFFIGTFGLVALGTGMSLAYSGTMEYGKKKQN